MFPCSNYDPRLDDCSPIHADFVIIVCLLFNFVLFQHIVSFSKYWLHFYFYSLQNTQQKINVSGLPGAWELFMQWPLFSSSPGDRMSMASVLTSLVLLDIGREILRPVLQPLITYVWSRWIHPGAQEKILATRVTSKLWVLYWTSLLTDLLLYSLETIAAQLITQGLPMLVDDVVEDGNSVIYLSSNCNGLIGYFNHAWSTHGLRGFYRGLSSLTLQYGIYALLLYVASKIAHSTQNRRIEQQT